MTGSLDTAEAVTGILLLESRTVRVLKDPCARFGHMGRQAVLLNRAQTPHGKRRGRVNAQGGLTARLDAVQQGASRLWLHTWMG